MKNQQQFSFLSHITLVAQKFHLSRYFGTWDRATRSVVETVAQDNKH